MDVGDVAMTIVEPKFTSMDMATPEEMANVFTLAKKVLFEPLPDTILGLLNTLKGEKVGYRVDRYEHSLQTATRAHRDGARTDVVVAGLLHDIGDALAPSNHSALAAAILEPYLDEETGWVVRHHGLFQQYHYGDKVGLVPNARD
jgi:predicted HD phosphohydrolase